VAGGGTADDRDYYYNDRWQLLVEVKDGTAYAIYHWHPFYIDALAARMRAADTHFFMHDANYNVTAAVLDDSTNPVVERYAYTAYGEVTVLDDDFSDDDNQESDIGNTHLYTGRERDRESGLQLNRARFYAAHLGRWVNRDPIGYRGSPYNLYEYARGAPIVATDAYGKFPWWLIVFPFLEGCRRAAPPAISRQLRRVQPVNRTGPAGRMKTDDCRTAAWAEIRQRCWQLADLGANTLVE
jgi:RHS repeat-associated protein